MSQFPMTQILPQRFDHLVIWSFCSLFLLAAAPFTCKNSRRHMFIFDAHLDLSMNALEWNRDLREPLDNLRERDRHFSDKPDRGNATVSFPEMRRGQIGIC